jgi:hypothetical protein
MFPVAVGKARCVELKMSSVRALTKYYIVSFIIVIALAFPDQGKHDFVLNQVMNMPLVITKFENMCSVFYLLEKHTDCCSSLLQLA